MQEDGALENILEPSACLQYSSNKMLLRLPSQNYLNNVHLDPSTNDKTELFLEDP